MAEKKSPAPPAKAAAAPHSADKAKGGAKGHDAKAAAPAVVDAEKAVADKAAADKAAADTKVSRFAGSSQVARGVKGQFIEIFKGIVSPDGPTRRMSLFFFVSLTALVGVGVLTVRRAVRQSNEREAMALVAEQEALERTKEATFLGKTQVAGAEAARASMISVGQFTIELKAVPGHPKSKGFMNMAELELVVECDSADTHTYIEENLVQARSQLTDIFLSMDRDELLTREGKRKLKKRLIERLNGWMPRGKIQNVFFAKLVVA